MALDTETFQAEVDSVLDKQEAEAATAAGVKGAETSEETPPTSENTGTTKQETETAVGSTDPEADREEAEAKKVLGDETSEEIEDVTTDTDEKTPVQFNDTVLARAVACGITLTEARSFPDNGTLNRFVDSVEQNFIHDAAPEKEEVKKDDEPDLFAGLPELNPDDYSPEVLQHLDRYKEVLAKQQEQLNANDARAESVSQSARDAGESEMRGWFDKAVAGLGDDYKEVLGEGAFGSLVETSQEFVNRDNIAGHIALMYDGYVAQGREPPSRDKLFDAAVRAVLPDARNGIQQRKLEGELEEQASQHLQRVRGSSNKSVKSPEEETAALLKEKFNL